MSNFKIPKKLIEVALPLDEINKQAGLEKSIRHGHPSTVHLWWARRPLLAARAVLFAQLVNDPGGARGWTTGKTKAQADKEREELFSIMRELCKWENNDNQELFEKANNKIRESWEEVCSFNKNRELDPNVLPKVQDPFAGGGAIPFEAARLGLSSVATDLNPVAVSINKALLEISYSFQESAPVGPIPSGEKQRALINDWKGAEGLAEDVRRYGLLLKERARKCLEDFYPHYEIPSELGGGQGTVAAWLWARTVKSPNPAANGKYVPLIKSLKISGQKNNEAWLVPDITDSGVSFSISTKKSDTEIESTIGRKGGLCIYTGTPIPLKYIREEGRSGNLKEQLLAVVVEGNRKKLFLPATEEQEVAFKLASKNTPSVPSLPIDHWAGCTNCVVYGYDTFDKLYNERQKLALDTLSNELADIQKMVFDDAIKCGLTDDDIGLKDGGKGAKAYSEAIKVYLSFLIDQVANHSSSFCGWNSTNTQMRSLYSRHAISMAWDYAESNVFSNSSGSFSNLLERQVKAISSLGIKVHSQAYQMNAEVEDYKNKVISTDPPYYDNVPYSNISEFFYVWLRRNIKDVYPELFTTIGVPKAEELVANQFRHGGREEAHSFFMNGMGNVFSKVADEALPGHPITIYYAFKQTDEVDSNTHVSRGWVSFIEGLIDSNLAITGTWPLRTEKSGRMVGIGSNALASSIVLVCRRREKNSATCTRRDLQRELKASMPDALDAMLGGTIGSSPIAPVDLAQAAIGPGMAIFSKYEAVLNQDGSKMSVHDALILINRAITDYLNPDSGNFDNDTLFCDDWFSQYGWGQGQFGEADTLARAKGTSVDGVRDAGVIESGGGKVRLLKWSEYPTDWDPKTDTRTPVWEACHQMIRVLNQQGEAEAGALLARMPERGEHIRQLAYHLYTLCERKKWAEEARAYNELIGSWHAIVAASHEVGHRGTQSELGLDF